MISCIKPLVSSLTSACTPSMSLMPRLSMSFLSGLFSRFNICVSSVIGFYPFTEVYTNCSALSGVTSHDGNNTNDIPLTVTAEKFWASVPAGTSHPTSASLLLTRSDSVSQGAKAVNAEGDWQTSWIGLLRYAPDGAPYTYVLTEPEVPENYTAKITGNYLTGFQVVNAMKTPVPTYSPTPVPTAQPTAAPTQAPTPTPMAAPSEVPAPVLTQRPATQIKGGAGTVNVADCYE
ncbi:MAG: Cna B-type domain-containing protein [Clostridiales bacterium]|nr:Cna B-type domain-containing protein [Clostridiales bacterium]